MLKQPMYLLDKAVVLFFYSIHMLDPKVEEVAVEATEEVVEETAEEETA